MASVKVKRLDRKNYPGVERQIKKSIKVIVDSNDYGKDNLGSNVDDIFNWWISNDSVAKYMAKKLQYKIEL
jgi:hypothetical protein